MKSRKVHRLCLRSRPSDPSCQLSESALLLLVLGILANNHYVALALDDLALFTNGLYGRSHFHDAAS
jgi:hypothetical protein